MVHTEKTSTEEYDWEEIKRIRRPARVWGEEDAVLIMLRGKRRQLRKVIVVRDNLLPHEETAAILDRIANKRFSSDW